MCFIFFVTFLLNCTINLSCGVTAKFMKKIKSPTRLGRGRQYGKNIIFIYTVYIYITIHDVIVVFLFCKFFEHYRQTNSPIIKTKAYNGNKIFLKSMVDI